MQPERAPSIKSLLGIRDCSPAQAELIRRVIKSTVYDELGLLPYFSARTTAWVNSCYHRPAPHAVRMFAIDEIIGNYGVEVIRSNKAYWEYSNNGETYDLTVIRSSEGGYFVRSWGDLVESAERRGHKFE